MTRNKKNRPVNPPQTQGGKPAGNWFEKNPKKTLVFFFLLFFLGLTVITEKILATRSQSYRSYIKRYIRLRDYEPLYSGSFVPTEDELNKGDTLVKKPYRFRVDDNGFTMPSKIYQEPDLTLVFLGGSTTLCAYVEEENRFPYRTGRLIEAETGLKVNSYNSGVGGNYTLHSIDILYNKVIPLRPHIAVLSHNINDLTVLLHEKTYWSKNPTRSPIVAVKPFTFNRKELIEFLIPNLYNELKSVERTVRRKLKPKTKSIKDEFQHVRGKKITIDGPRIVGEFKKNLQTFINICRAWNIIPVLMTQENRLKEKPDPITLKEIDGFGKEHGISYKEYKDIYDQFNQATRDVGSQNNLVVIDLANKIPQEKEYMFDVVHLTDAGSRLAAKIISADLQPLVRSLKGRGPGNP